MATPPAPAAATAARFEQLRTDPERLDAFMRAFPKGGDIHHHLIGTPTPDLFMNVGAERGFCLAPATLEATAGPCADGAVPFGELAAHPDLSDRLRDAWSLRALSPGADDVPAHFFGVFPQIWTLSDDRGLLLAHLKRQASRENLVYLETQLQTPAPTDAIRAAAMTLGLDADTDVLALREALEQAGVLGEIVAQSMLAIESYDATARQALGCDAAPRADGCNVAHRYQMYALRILPNPMVLADMILAFEVAHRSPAVVGVNVVGFEGDANALTNYEAHMAALAALRDAYPDVRLALHAGELTSREADDAALKSHVPDAVYVARADRIGHGNAIATSANREALLAYLAEERIPVELSLTSNHWLLGLVGETHHLPLLSDAGVLFTLNTDDAGIFVTDLSREYALAARLYPWLDYAAFKRLSRMSLEVSFLPGDSLWQDVDRGTTVDGCAVLGSPACDALTATSPRAAAQRQLEQRFVDFERRVVGGALQ
ncbi:MAG: hypothetical protein AAFU65_02065 [Pseudomonadota bacterium]